MSTRILDRKSMWATRVSGLLACVLFAASPAALAVRISAALPAGAPIQFVIQPGQSTTFSIDFTNLDNQQGQGIGRGRHYLPGVNTSLMANWVLEPIDLATCGYPMQGEGLRLEFPVELLASETRRCTYTITRRADTYSDGYLQICTGEDPQPNCSDLDLLVFGTLPDVGVSVLQVGAPAAVTGETMYRIDLSNAAAVATAESNLYSSCQFTGMANPAANMPFSVELGFPGACPGVTPRACNTDLPITHHGWELKVPSIPVGGSTSCLVKLRPRDPAGPAIADRFASWLAFPFFPGHPVPLLHLGPGTPGGQGYDMNQTNNLATFTLAPLGQAAQPVPTGRWALLMLAVLTAAFGWLRLRKATMR